VPSLGRIPAWLVLEDGSVYPHAGHLNFVEQRIDKAIRTAAGACGGPPNPTCALLPGQFVRIRIEGGECTAGVLSSCCWRQKVIPKSARLNLLSVIKVNKTDDDLPYDYIALIGR
jgi:hypothetical protein